ncbi:MAG: glycosyltransferase family 2 protein [Saprospiraceae bacterium]|nr:glycosyltransferase family 2 protein [Saprospiraceae bacterium]
MELSVIIVSYNVRAFLEKCLLSVYQAMQGIDGEIFVVDNHSLDGSADLVREKFPSVQLISNSRNLGFASANNQALRKAAGEFVLLLNPDTVVSEDTFSKCIAFMRAHPDAGAVGVSMLDGTGTWLPESKRGLPSPLSAMFKLTGINTLFPRSNFFNRYYLGGLDPAATNPVEVLSGAFMFMRKAAVEKVGYLDEDYFMYGEDIDLSFRLLKAGYTNYYLPTTSIIHYKGESTKRSSVEYVRTFYRAMLIFVHKNYTGPRGLVLTQFLRLGIFLRATLSALSRVGTRLMPLLIDTGLIVGVILGVKWAWARWYFQDPGHFDEGFLQVNLPLYTGLWLVMLYLFGAYTQRSSGRVVRGILAGTLLILLAYALLPLPFRSSRAVILLGSLVLLVVMGAWSHLLQVLRRKQKVRRVAVVGSQSETHRIMELLNRIAPQVHLVGGISVSGRPEATDHIGQLDDLDRIAVTHRIDEIIFSSADLPFSEISIWMARLSPKVRFKIASSKSDTLVGSDSRHLAGDLYTSEIRFAIASPLQRRNKRLLDLAVAAGAALLAPLALFSKTLREMLQHVPHVIRGSHTWVSYDTHDRRVHELPVLRPGLMTPGRLGEGGILDPAERHMINYLYAREYRVWRDVEILLGRGTKVPD